MRIKAFLFIYCIFVFGCSSYVYSDLPTSELILFSDKMMTEGEYTEAASGYENAIYNAADSNEAMAAQYKLAMAYFIAGKYIDAAASLEVYKDLYYDASNMPIVLYRLAVCYYKLSFSPSRDQTFTEKSIDYFNTLKQSYPYEYEMLMADEIYYKMINKISESDLLIAQYYERQKAYQSALVRYVYIINNYPESNFVLDAYKGAIEMFYKTGDKYGLLYNYIKEFKESFPNEKLPKKYDDI